MARMIVFLSFFFLFSPLTAEIQQVILTWQQDACNENCAERFKRSLDSIPAINTVRINIEQARAEISWKPEEKFSYRVLNVASRKVGVNIREWIVRVHGTISRVGTKYYINSIGDKTRFELLSLPPPAPDTQYVQYKNISSYKLSDELKEAFREAMMKDQLVIVSGYLFQPWRNPLAIVVEQYRVEK